MLSRTSLVMQGQTPWVLARARARGAASLSGMPIGTRLSWFIQQEAGERVGRRAGGCPTMGFQTVQRILGPYTRRRNRGRRVRSLFASG